MKLSIALALLPLARSQVCATPSFQIILCLTDGACVCAFSGFSQTLARLVVTLVLLGLRRVPAKHKKESTRVLS